MTRNRKLIVSDYDQTFYINDEDIEKNKRAVSEFEKCGNIFIIATGRSFFDFKNRSNAYNIDYNYVILNHGATIIDKKDDIIYDFSIDNKVIPEIKKEVNLDESIKHFCCSGLESRVEFEYGNLTKIYVKYDTREKAMEINESLNKKFNKYITSYYVTGNAVEVISNKTNKSKAIRLLMKKFNIDDKNVYTIGDGFSDIEMVKDFNGYCMIESVDELKKVAIKEYASVSDLIGEVINS